MWSGLWSGGQGLVRWSWLYGPLGLPHTGVQYGQGIGRVGMEPEPSTRPPVFQQHGIPLEAFLPPGKAQAPLPPPPPPKPVGWECPACTFVNKPARPGCEQCGTPRPDDYKFPNDASLDDREKRDAELLNQVRLMGVASVRREVMPGCIKGSLLTCMWTA